MPNVHLFPPSDDVSSPESSYIASNEASIDVNTLWKNLKNESKAKKLGKKGSGGNGDVTRLWDVDEPEDEFENLLGYGEDDSIMKEMLGGIGGMTKNHNKKDQGKGGMLGLPRDLKRPVGGSRLREELKTVEEEAGDGKNLDGEMQRAREREKKPKGGSERTRTDGSERAIKERDPNSAAGNARTDGTVGALGSSLGASGSSRIPTKGALPHKEDAPGISKASSGMKSASSQVPSTSSALSSSLSFSKRSNPHHETSHHQPQLSTGPTAPSIISPTSTVATNKNAPNPPSQQPLIDLLSADDDDLQTVNKRSKQSETDPLAHLRSLPPHPIPVLMPSKPAPPPAPQPIPPTSNAIISPPILQPRPEPNLAIATGMSKFSMLKMRDSIAVAKESAQSFVPFYQEERGHSQGDRRQEGRGKETSRGTKDERMDIDDTVGVDRKLGESKDAEGSGRTVSSTSDADTLVTAQPSLLKPRRLSNAKSTTTTSHHPSQRPRASTTTGHQSQAPRPSGVAFPSSSSNEIQQRQPSQNKDDMFYRRVSLSGNSLPPPLQPGPRRSISNPNLAESSKKWPTDEKNDLFSRRMRDSNFNRGIVLEPTPPPEERDFEITGGVRRPSTSLGIAMNGVAGGNGEKRSRSRRDESEGAESAETAKETRRKFAALGIGPPPPPPLVVEDENGMEIDERNDNGRGAEVEEERIEGEPNAKRRKSNGSAGSTDGGMGERRRSSINGLPKARRISSTIGASGNRARILPKARRVSEDAVGANIIPPAGGPTPSEEFVAQYRHKHLAQSSSQPAATDEGMVLSDDETQPPPRVQFSKARRVSNATSNAGSIAHPFSPELPANIPTISFPASSQESDKLLPSRPPSRSDVHALPLPKARRASNASNAGTTIGAAETGRRASRVLPPASVVDHEPQRKAGRASAAPSDVMMEDANHPPTVEAPNPPKGNTDEEAVVFTRATRVSLSTARRDRDVEKQKSQDKSNETKPPQKLASTSRARATSNAGPRSVSHPASVAVGNQRAPSRAGATSSRAVSNPQGGAQKHKDLKEMTSKDKNTTKKLTAPKAFEFGKSRRREEKDPATKQREEKEREERIRKEKELKMQKARAARRTVKPKEDLLRARSRPRAPSVASQKKATTSSQPVNPPQCGQQPANTKQQEQAPRSGAPFTHEAPGNQEQSLTEAALISHTSLERKKSRPSLHDRVGEFIQTVEPISRDRQSDDVVEALPPTAPTEIQKVAHRPKATTQTSKPSQSSRQPLKTKRIVNGAEQEIKSKKSGPTSAKPFTFHATARERRAAETGKEDATVSNGVKRKR